MEVIKIDKFPACETTARINGDKIKEINRKLKCKKFKLKEIYSTFPNKTCTKFSYFKNVLKQSHTGYRRLDIILHACNLIKIKPRELENCITSYRTRKSKILINKPKIPIKVSPVFYMLIAHLIGDGGYIRFKNKETIYSGYRQFNKKLRLSFLDKARYVFGDITYTKDYFNKSTRVYLPEVPSLIIRNFVNRKTEFFLSRKARIPENFLKSKKGNLVAILTAFIIDEGNIEGTQIAIRLINKNLVEDLAKICEILNYKHTIGKRSPCGMYNLYILSEGLKKYWKDYKRLKKRYNFLTMDFKEQAIK